VDATTNLDTRLAKLLDAIAAQEPAISALADVTEKQADMIAGVSLVLRGLIDTIMDEQQRQMLKRHLEMTGSSDVPRVQPSIIDALLS
jgi:uncharacterized coiled-coil protein SlyX